MPRIDAINGLITAGFQVTLALVPFYALLRQWKHAFLWGSAALVLGVVLYFTWYRNLPAKDDLK